MADFTHANPRTLCGVNPLVDRDAKLAATLMGAAGSETGFSKQHSITDELCLSRTRRPAHSANYRPVAHRDRRPTTC